MSNVKKGDAAQIRGVPAPLNEANGRVVIVGDRTIMPSGVVGWFVDPPQRVVVSEDCNTESSFRYRGEVILITVFDDAYLHPLRGLDPAEGDEVLDQVKLGTGDMLEACAAVSEAFRARFGRRAE
jgi:hypothetical protein